MIICSTLDFRLLKPNLGIATLMVTDVNYPLKSKRLQWTPSYWGRGWRGFEHEPLRISSREREPYRPLPQKWVEVMLS